MWANRLIIAAGIALVVVAAVDAVRSSDRKTSPSLTSASATTAKTEGGTLSLLPNCAHRDMSVRIEIRRPSPLQTHGGKFEAPKGRRLATIVVQTVGARRCLGTWPFLFRIKDRTGKEIWVWTDVSWFAVTWRPNSKKTFSLPDVYECDRPGPFVALAMVGPYTVRRGHLSRNEITC